ncbi:MAG: HD family hydrolase [Thermotogae bacterium]|nr:HD family hydrolase [Thermotogota bacterium]
MEDCKARSLAERLALPLDKVERVIERVGCSPLDVLAYLVWEFMEDSQRLKLIPRSGWWYYGVKEPESVAEHTTGVAMLSFVMAAFLRELGEKVDPYKAATMALFHELGESRIGDVHLEARRYIPSEELERAEAMAYNEVVSVLGDVGNSIRDLYREFESRSSPEALVVRAADKLELLFQALSYERHGYRTLQPFWETKENWKDFHHYSLAEALYNILLLLRSEIS